MGRRRFCASREIVALAIMALKAATVGSGAAWPWAGVRLAIHLSKFFCEPRPTMSGLLSHAVMYLAKSVLVMRRAAGIASFNALSLAGVVPSRARRVL